MKGNCEPPPYTPTMQKQENKQTRIHSQNHRGSGPSTTNTTFSITNANIHTIANDMTNNNNISTTTTTTTTTTTSPAPPPPLECTPEGDVVIRAHDGHRYRRSVCVFIMNADGYFLAGRRRDDRRVLQCVQGGATPHESPMQTAEREVFEELGIPPARLRLIAEIPPPTEITGSRENINHFAHDPRAVFRYNSKTWRKYGIKGQELYPLLVRAETEVIHTLNFAAVPGVRPEFCAAKWVTLEELMQFCSPSKQEVVRHMCAAVRPLALRVLSEEGMLHGEQQQQQQQQHNHHHHQEKMHLRYDGSSSGNNAGFARGRW